MKKGRYSEGSPARYIFKTGVTKNTAPAPVVEIPTRRAAWLRLVNATRRPADVVLLEAHRAIVAGRLG